MSKDRIRLFISYSHKDMKIKEKFCKQLDSLKNNSIIDYWSDAEIPAGGDIDEAVLEAIRIADVFVLMISPDFLNSYYCIEKETKAAIERHNKKEAIVVPCICRECVSLDNLNFSSLKRVPADGRPITSFRSYEKGCVEAVKLIKDMVTTVFSDRIKAEKTKNTNTSTKRTTSSRTNTSKRENASTLSSTKKNSKNEDVNKIGVVLYSEGKLDTISINKSVVSKLPTFYKNLSDLNNHLKNFTKDGITTYKRALKSKKIENAESDCFKVYLMELCTAIRRYITDSSGVRVHFRGNDGNNFVGIIASAPDDDDDDKVNWNVKLTPIPTDRGLIYYSLLLNAPLLKSLNKSINYKANNDDLWPEYYTEALTLDKDVVLSLGISFNRDQFKRKEYLMYFLTMTRFGDLIKSHINNYVEQCKKVNSSYDLKSTVNKLLVMGD